MATKTLRSLLSLRPITSLTNSLTAINQIRSYKVVPNKKGEKPKIKHRKGRIEGIRDGGNNICFGKYALQALEPARITSRQIEAGRKALQLNVRRGGAKGGKVWVRVCAWKTVTSKPAEVRMGRGKGNFSYLCAPVQKGQIIYEMGGVMESLAKRAIQIAGSKMPIQTRLIVRDATTKEIGIR